MLSRENFINEFGGIIRLFQEHKFLIYSNNFSEYQQKERTAAAEFVSIVRKRTGLNLPKDYSVVHVSEARSATIGNAKVVMRKAHLFYKKKASEYPPESQQYKKFFYYAELWKVAISRL